MLIYDLATYQLEWENTQLRYTRIDFMTPANLDPDPQQEVVILADDRLYRVGAAYEAARGLLPTAL